LEIVKTRFTFAGEILSQQRRDFFLRHILTSQLLERLEFIFVLSDEIRQFYLYKKGF
jgi:hypothetical protein